MSTATQTRQSRSQAQAQAPVRSRKKAAPGQDRTRIAHEAATAFKQLSDPTRLQVIMILSEGEQHVGALCASLGQSQPATSHHLALLRHSNIIAPRRVGKNNFYGLTDKGASLAAVAKAMTG